MIKFVTRTRLLTLACLSLVLFAGLTKEVSANAKYGRLLKDLHEHSIDEYNVENKPLYDIVEEGPSRGDEVIEYKVNNFIIQNSIVPFNIVKEEVVEENGEIVYDNRPSQDEIDEQKEIIRIEIEKAEKEDIPMKIGVGIIAVTVTVGSIGIKYHTEPDLVV